MLYKKINYSSLDYNGFTLSKLFVIILCGGFLPGDLNIKAVDIVGGHGRAKHRIDCKYSIA